MQPGLNNTNTFLWLKPAIIKFTPVLIILLNLILKFAFITHTSVAGDEPFSIYHAQMDLSSIFDLMKTENNPPVHFIILHYWIKLFGISPLSVRFLSVIFSALTAYVIYKTGNKFFSYHTGLAGSLLFSFSNLNLLLAHEARVYTLFGLLAALSMFYFMCVSNYKNKTSYFILLLVTNLLLVYSHYFGFFIIAVQTIAVLIIKDIRKSCLKNYLIYLLIFVCLYFPNILILISRFSVSAKGTWVVKPNGVAAIYDMLWSFSNKPVTTVLCILILIAAFVKLFLPGSKATNSPNKKIIILWFLFPFLFMFIISFWVPMFLDRYLIFVSIAYYLVIAIAIAYLIKPNKFKYALSCLMVLLFAFTFNPDMDNKRQVKETVAKVMELKDNNTSVIICNSYFMLNFAYYYSKEIFSEVDNENKYQKITKRLNNEKIYPINSANLITMSTKRVIFVDAAADWSFPDNNIYNTLYKRYRLKNEYQFYEIFKVYEFENL